jgi:acetylornithine deacetylase/succinyl-diaminopimelate desuccinylase-like protein
MAAPARPAPDRPTAPDALTAAVVACHDTIVARQVMLAETPAPTGAESARGALVAEWLSDGGATVRRDAVGNVIARVGAAVGPPIAVLAHLDTVFAANVPLAVRRDGVRLVGPGIGDNARGLAVLSMLPALLRRAGLTRSRPIDLVATVGEEGVGDLRGAHAYLDMAAPAPSAVIALDSPGDDRVIHIGVGARRLRLTVDGPGGHSWVDYAAPSALHAAMALARSVEALAGPPAAVHGGTAVGVTIARLIGGEAINAIPRRAELDVEFRARTEALLDDAERRWEAIVAEGGRAYRTLHFSVVPLSRRAAGQLPATHPLVRQAVAATRAIGRRAVLASGSTDANAALARGIPAIALGAGGRGDGAHTLEEWFDPTDGAAGVVRVVTLLRALATP